MKKIGIVGGGQLGRMLAIAGKKLGFEIIILDPTPNSPAGQVADRQIVGSFKDKEKIQELANQVDYLTFEIELANADILDEISKKIPVNPSAKTLTIIKDKLSQKEFLQKAHIPTADFAGVVTRDDIVRLGRMFGYPLLLKARFDAYDGRGNYVIKNEREIAFGMEKLKDRKLYVEKYVPFVKEIAVMVARNTVGEVMVYPVVQTSHKNNICHTVVVPADVNEKVTDKAKSVAISVMEHLHGAGVFGIEMFLDRKGNVLINEIAPRVHNSGHYTIEACKTSQFEQHIRAITGMELGSTDLIVPAAAMVNILGEREGASLSQMEGVQKAEAMSGVSVHMYGKKEVRIERKMGHITAVADTPEEALEKALLARKYISI